VETRDEEPGLSRVLPTAASFGKRLVRGQPAPGPSGASFGSSWRMCWDNSMTWGRWPLVRQDELTVCRRKTGRLRPDRGKFAAVNGSTRRLGGGTVHFSVVLAAAAIFGSSRSASASLARCSGSDLRITFGNSSEAVGTTAHLRVNGRLTHIRSGCWLRPGPERVQRGRDNHLGWRRATQAIWTDSVGQPFGRSSQGYGQDAPITMTDSSAVGQGALEAGTRERGDDGHLRVAGRSTRVRRSPWGNEFDGSGFGK